jgi:hypothetical protein
MQGIEMSVLSAVSQVRQLSILIGVTRWGLVRVGLIAGEETHDRDISNLIFVR